MPQDKPKPRFNWTLLGSLTAAVVMLAIAAVLFSAGDDDNADGGAASTPTVAGATIEEQRAVSVVGDELPTFPGSGATDPAVGMTAPELRAASFDGSAVNVAADGTPKVIVFLAHWCPHCQAEVPRIAEWLDDNGPLEGVQILGVATSTTKDRPNHPPSKWLEREGFDVPVLADDKAFTAARVYGLSGFPYFVALDGQNKVVRRVSGELKIEQFEALVNQARRAG